MTPNNWVSVAVGALAFLTALLGYLKTRVIDRQVRTTNYYVNGRYTDLLVENRRLREAVAADTGAPNAVELVKDALEQQHQPERGRHEGNS
jgi:hypothetical protein